MLLKINVIVRYLKVIGNKSMVKLGCLVIVVGMARYCPETCICRTHC